MLDAANPYESPRGISLRAVDEDRPWVGGIRIGHVQRGFLYRRLEIEAPLAAVLEYHGNTFGETVSIDGQIATREVNHLWPLFAPRFNFALRSQGKLVPVVVEVRIGWSLQIRAFRVQIAGHTVYAEGSWKSALNPAT